MAKFELSEEMEDKLVDLFGDLIEDGGMLAVKDILQILSSTAEELGEMLKDEGTNLKLANDLTVASDRIARFIKSGFLRG